MLLHLLSIHVAAWNHVNVLLGASICHARHCYMQSCMQSTVLNAVMDFTVAGPCQRCLLSSGPAWSQATGEASEYQALPPISLLRLTNEGNVLQQSHTSSTSVMMMKMVKGATVEQSLTWQLLAVTFNAAS